MGATIAGFVLAAGLTLSLSATTRAAAPWMVYALFAILGLALVLFATLTIEVDAAEIRVKFGVGVVRKTVAIADVISCEQLRTRIWWGWGLHWTPSGWLYNVGGRDAVRVLLARERPLILGSDEAAALKAAIDARLAAGSH